MRWRIAVLIALAAAVWSCSPGESALRLREPAGGDVGLVPTFRWEAVAGAASYRLSLLDADDFPVWSWQGSGTEVPLLGFEHEASLGGPVVTDGSKWSVVALDGDGGILAVSEVGVISPGVAAPSAAPIATPGSTLAVSDLPEDPCRLLAREDVAPFFGGNPPPPQVARAEGWVECRIEQGPFGYLRLTIVSSSADRIAEGTCSNCQDVSVGDHARGRTSPSGGILHVLSGDLLFTAEATGLGDVTLDQLADVVRAAISRL